jgi:hypothetical protein
LEHDDTALTEGQARLCLASIVHYYLLRLAQRPPGETRRQLADRICTYVSDSTALSDTDLNNMINRGAKKGAQHVNAYFKAIIFGEKPGEGKRARERDELFSPAELPEHIKVAIRNLYGVIEAPTGAMPPHPPEDGFNLSDVRYVRHNGPSIVKDIIASYEGVYRVIRYSAHASPGEIPIWGKSTDEPADVWTVLATMEIRRNRDEHQDPIFEIHYKPGQSDKRTHVTIKGSVVPVGGGHHLFFLGGEKQGYPLCIFSPILVGRPTEFPGLIVRKHEYGPIFASRLLFVRAEEATQLSDLDEEIGIQLESALKNDLRVKIPSIDRILAKIKNEVLWKGRYVLKLAEGAPEELPHQARGLKRRRTTKHPSGRAKRNLQLGRKGKHSK